MSDSSTDTSVFLKGYNKGAASVGTDLPSLLESRRGAIGVLTHTDASA